MTIATPDPEILFRPLLGSRGVLLAVSGGKDSTALMVMAAHWSKGEGAAVPVFVATVDHGLRPEAADETALVCANARRLGLDCMALQAHMGADAAAAEDDPPRDGGGNLQALAREARYRCLADAAREKGCDTIVTAHHRDDQAETFLIRLARGSGVYGLGAMSGRADLNGLALFRPLLDTGRSVLHRITAESGLASVEDPSNLDMAFARIRWRSMMPELEAAGLTAERLAQTAGRLRRAADALDHYAGALLETHVAIDEFGAASGDAGFLADAPDETALRALARLLQAVGGTDYTPRLDRTEQLLAAIRAESGGPDGLRRTLNDCVVDLKSGQLRIYREWGRAGPAQCEARPGARMIWDGRFAINLPADLPDGLAVAPLGAHDGLDGCRGDQSLLRTIPGLFARETLYALPEIGGWTGGRAGMPLFACECLVDDRLLNPRSNRAIT
jgi:tRNA(Ile)-lysidine synthase